MIYLKVIVTVLQGIQIVSTSDLSREKEDTTLVCIDSWAAHLNNYYLRK